MALKIIQKGRIFRAILNDYGNILLNITVYENSSAECLALIKSNKTPKTSKNIL